MDNPVVELQQVEPGIVQLVMRDERSRNGFSLALMGGLLDAFRRIEEWPDCRVVVMTGYENYFCSGGTQEALLSLQAGQASFTDTKLYSLPLECSVPVVAAMQGHAIGGGFVFGLFADCAVLSRESLYTTNFMKYGFTPGMGATCIVPRKLGMALAEEMLLGARSYRGADLERRGVPFQVVPRADVLGRALDLARDLAEKPRLSLVTLKSHLVLEIRTQLDDIVRREVEMHARTLPQPEVRERIINTFGR